MQNDHAGERRQLRGSKPSQMRLLLIFRGPAVRLALRLAIALTSTHAAMAEHSGVINDPDGYVNVRSDKRVNAPVVAKVKSGEPFTFESEAGDQWCKVTLSSGKTGWMHHSRIRLHFTGKDLRGKTTPNDELHYIRAKLGVDYYALARRAAGGNRKSLEKYFGITDTDGAAAEMHFSALPEVFHLVGDTKFAEFLRRQPLAYQLEVRASLTRGYLTAGAFEIIAYLQRHFPQTAKLLFRREVIDWPSPDGRYVIRKVFSDADDLDNSRVVLAEIFEKTTGKVLCNMTADDIGTGAEREGDVLWSPDSERFAYRSSRLPIPSGNLFSTPRPPVQKKQTMVYQRSGERFVRVDLPLNDISGRDRDTEVKEAVLGHQFIEPVKWLKPHVLVLQRHEYFEKLQPEAIGDTTFETIRSFGRLYEITVTIRPNHIATATTKLLEDR